MINLEQDGETATGPFIPILAVTKDCVTGTALWPAAFHLGPSCVGLHSPMGTSALVVDSKPLPSGHFCQVLPSALR